jgi:hypothetical protein
MLEENSDRLKGMLGEKGASIKAAAIITGMLNA